MNRPLDHYRAINSAHYRTDAARWHPRRGRKPFPFVVRVYRDGLVVTSARIKTRFVIPSRRTKFAHYPRFAWIAWQHGQPVLSQVRYLCGGYSWTARGEDTSEFPVCPRCQLAVLEPEEVARVLEERAFSG